MLENHILKPQFPNAEVSMNTIATRLNIKYLVCKENLQKKKNKRGYNARQHKARLKTSVSGEEENRNDVTVNIKSAKVLNFYYILLESHAGFTSMNRSIISGCVYMQVFILYCMFVAIGKVLWLQNENNMIFL